MSYDWLNSETAPRVLVQAVKRIGVKEVVGKEHNPIILSWARELKLSSIYNSDEIPWCGLFIAYCCYAANIEMGGSKAPELLHIADIVCTPVDHCT